MLLFFFALVYVSLKKTKKMLTQDVNESGRIFLNEFEVKRNPYVNMNQIQQPKYLSNPLGSRNNIRYHTLKSLRQFFEG